MPKRPQRSKKKVVPAFTFGLDAAGKSSLHDLAAYCSRAAYDENVALFRQRVLLAFMEMQGALA